MSSDQALRLQEHHHWASGEEEVDGNHAVGGQLSRDVDEVEVGLHTPLVLGDSVAHRQDERVEELEERKAYGGVDGLDSGQSKSPTLITFSGSENKGTSDVEM